MIIINIIILTITIIIIIIMIMMKLGTASRYCGALRSTRISDSASQGGFYLVCEHGKHRNAKQYNFGCNFWFSSPPCPKSITIVLGGKTKVIPKIVPFSKQKLTVYFHYTDKVETPDLNLGTGGR